MRTNYFRPLVIAGLTALLAVSCAKPKKSDEQAGATGEGGQPVITDQAVSADPRGSDGGAIPGLSSVFFEYDQARLTSDARKKLAENAQWIKDHPDYTVQIEGHTDERGSVEYNLSLGERRARSVKSYLEGLGVDSKRMTIISYGEEKPLETGDSEAAFSKNRRANFVPLR